MNREIDLLFVYGTLMKGFTNPVARHLHSTQVFLGEASFPGILFHVSFYPGAVHVPEATSLVHGHLFKIVNNQEELFRKLDAYEGIGGEYDAPHEFKKAVIPIHFSGKTIEAATYLYNTSYDHYPIIPSGDFKK
jgi:gamma-glutamylcyclotransferase (GGCT)/AIG2-like uncharacterized protein YtfP